MKHYVILLATADANVEAAVQAVGDGSDCELSRVQSTQEVVSMVMDGRLEQDFGVVDLEMRKDSRALLRTMGGALPVIVISGEASPWLSSLLRHQQIGASLVKPVSSKKLWEAVHHMQSHCQMGPPSRARPLVETNHNS